MRSLVLALFVLPLACASSGPKKASVGESATSCPNGNQAYARIARRIVERIADLNHAFAPIDGMDGDAPFRTSTITDDKLDLAFELERDVTWVKPEPTSPPMKQSMKPKLGPDGIAMHLYFSSEKWSGQAMVPEHKVGAMNVVVFVTIADETENDRLYDAIVSILRDEDERIASCR